MIKKHGKITITEDEIIISDFVFEDKSDDTLLACGDDALKWAMKRIADNVTPKKTDGT